MTTRKSPEIKKPKNLDLDKAERLVRVAIGKNTTWIKEMANK